MADSITIARPYARALFSEATDHATFDVWHKSIEAFADIVDYLSEQQIIGDPRVSNQQLLQLCFDLIKQVTQAPSEFEESLKRFIELILVEGRLAVIPDIAVLYHKLLMEHGHMVEVDVTSAMPLTDQEKQELIKSLEKRFNSKVTTRYFEDPSLIGGLIVKSNGWVFDGTILSQLNSLAKRII